MNCARFIATIIKIFITTITSKRYKRDDQIDENLINDC